MHLYRGTWAAQSLERLTLDFGLGHDLMVVLEPCLRLCAGSAACSRFSLSAPPPHAYVCTHTPSLNFSLKIN